MSATYTWEAGTEGFTITGDGTEVYTFDNYTNPDTGTSDNYTFEGVDSKYSFIDAINAYTVAEVRDIDLYIAAGIRADERVLKRVTVDDTYDQVRFNGEVK